MSVEKAVIINTETGDEARVLFNPEEYTLNLANEFAEVAIPGLPTPPIQYIRGQGKNLQMELLVDSYEQRADVRGLIARLASFLKASPVTGAPPILLFSWASLNFECVLAQLNQRFTMFLDDGTPVRAKLDVTFKEFEEVTIEVQTGFFVGPPTVRSLASGQTLTQLAADVLGDPGQWRVIADANNIDNPRKPPVGEDLIIPPKEP